MANNTTLNGVTEAGGDVIRDIDRSSVKTQVVALDLNPAGAETLMAGSMPVTAASLPLPTGASTAANQTTGNTSLASLETKVGEVVASPTANTVLDRLKTIAANILTTLAVNITQLGGTAVDTNSGVKSAGTQRMVLATDQPQLTNALKVDGSAVTQPVSAASLPLPTGASTAANQATGNTSLASLDTKLGEVAASPTANTVLDRLKALLTGISLAAGTNAIGKLAANSGVDIGDVDVTSIVMPTGASAAQVQGTVAHDGVDAQNPIGLGGRAIAHGTNPTAVAAADRTVLYTNRAGIPFVIGGHPNIVTIEAAYTAAQTDTAIVTIGSGLKIVVTQIQLLCDNANTVNVAARVGFGAANTPTTTGVVATHPGIAAGSGVSRGDGGGILGIGGDGEDLRITSGVPTTGSLRVLVSYYTIES